ncbi:MAG: Rieske (2Fe-2S) protein [Burkholderiales bacterium]|jgi:nitrite reductase/ring-hydroxylating ferredoxin subunit|nr:Rieske 2Fe-2S domain-containing protein [Nitrosomonadaceae bacterium]
MADATRMSGTDAAVICSRAVLQDAGLAARFVVEFNGRNMDAFAIAYQGKVHAYVNSCPHRGTTLDWEPGQVFDNSGIYLVCATHGALFEPDSGRCVGGPCQGASLTRVQVEDNAGQVSLVTGRLVQPYLPTTSSADPKGD